jgi:hypothetical protein
MVTASRRLAALCPRFLVYFLLTRSATLLPWGGAGGHHRALHEVVCRERPGQGRVSFGVSTARRATSYGRTPTLCSRSTRCKTALRVATEK